jgi:hypothetical protein
MGMVEVSADFYLEKGDEGYDKYMAEHYVQVPVIPKEGYPQQKELDNSRSAWDNKMAALYKSDPKGQYVAEDYKEYNSFKKETDLYVEWIKSLPTTNQLNSFCNHSIQFEHDATEEEILWCFEWALAQTHINYCCNDLHCEKGTPAKKVNQDIGYLSRKAFYEGVLQIPEKNRTDYMKQELAKIEKCNTRLTSIPVDFTTVKTIANYKVK